MKSNLKLALLLGAGLIMALAPNPVLATCNGISQPLFHGLGGYVEGCTDSRPVSGYVYVSTDVSINSNMIEIACAESGAVLPTQSLVCQLSAGTAGDGRVTINFNWGSPGPIVGCPNPTGVADVGRNTVVVIDNDGKSAVMEVGYNIIIAGYVMEQVNNGADTGPSGFPFCNNSGQPVFNRVEDLGGGDHNVCVEPQLPVIFSDCDAGAANNQNACDAASEVVWDSPANVYSKIDRCGRAQNLNISTGGWTDRGAPVGGEVCIPYNDVDVAPVCVGGDPALDGTPCAADTDCDGSTGGGQCDNLCVYAASNAVVANIPGPPGSCFMGIVCTAGPGAGLPCPGGDADCGATVVGDNVYGATQVAGGNLPASDRAVARLAELGKNVLKVEFTVSLEQNARSFDILADGRVLNDAPILAENRGNYAVTIEKAGGKLKGSKSIVIRTNLDGGGTLLSAPRSISKGN